MALTEISPANYYALCKDAETLGIPVSLDDPATPQTVEALFDAVALATQRSWVPVGNGAFPLRSEILPLYGLSEDAPVVLDEFAQDALAEELR